MEPIELTNLRRDEFAMLGEWLARPHVRRWWHHEVDPDAVERDVGPSVDGDAAAQRIWAVTPPIGCLIVPVHSDNVASWTALLRAGFHLVAQGELDPDNPADDGRHEILRLDRPAH